MKRISKLAVESSLLIAVAVTVFLLSPVQVAQAASFVFTRLADTNTPIPNGTGNFTGFLGYAAISNGKVVVVGIGGNGQQGIYRLQPEGPPIRVADLNTPIPGGSGNFTRFAPPDPVTPPSPSISGDVVGFFGAGAGGQQGIYRLQPEGPPNRVADLNTLIPDGTGNFTGFTPPDPVTPPDPIAQGNVLVFLGFGSSGQQGIYRAIPEGPPVRVVDLSSQVPQSDFQFSQFLGSPAVGGSDVVFIANGIGNLHGIYRKSVDFSSVIADLSTPIPGGTGNFESFLGSPSASGNVVAFFGAGSNGQQGVYRLAPEGPPDRVADLNTAIPGGTGNFTGFSDALSLSGQQVAFVGLGSGGQKGIYLTGSLNKVINLSDILDGKSLNNLRLGRQGWDGNQLAFVANFTDGSQGVYAASSCAQLEFSGFHAPIGGADATGGSVADPVRAFKLKSTVPVKMTLSCGGVPVTNGVHTIQVIKFSSATTSDPPTDATPTDAATPGNQFRLTEPGTGEWHFNLDTRATNMTKGIWQVKVTLADSSVHTAFIELK
jgi:hypothetical protein